MKSDLSKAATNDLLKYLKNLSHDAIRGFLRREGLRYDGNRVNCIKRIEKNINNAKISPTKLKDWIEELKRIQEAIKSLNGFNRRLPIIRQFCKEKNLFQNAPLQMLVNQVKTNLFRFNFPLSDWINHLDKYRENGMQHIFPYYLKRKHLRYLEKLRDSSYIQDCLKEQKLKKYYNEHRFIWEAQTPKLTEVIHKPYFDGILKLKWVETRKWKQRNIIKSERTLKYFILDLSSGDCEIRIQKIKPGQGGRAQLRKEFNTCCQLVDQLIDFEKFSPLLLEPAMRRLLITNELTQKSWKVKLSSGGLLIGRNDPSLFQSVGLTFQQFFASHLKGSWKSKLNNMILIELDGNTDQIYIHRECGAEDLTLILSDIKQLSTKVASADKKEYRIKKINDKKEEPNGLEADRASKKVFEYMRALGRWEITLTKLERLAENMWISTENILQAFESSLYTKGYSAKYYIRCPDTKKPVTYKGKKVYYQKLNDIPNEILCENIRGRPKKHTTRNNILFSIGHSPMETRWPVGFRFLLAFIPLILLTTLCLLYMLNIFNTPLQCAIILMTYLALLIVEMAVAIKSTGRGNLKLAFEVVKGLWKAVSGKFFKK